MFCGPRYSCLLLPGEGNPRMQAQCLVYLMPIHFEDKVSSEDEILLLLNRFSASKKAQEHNNSRQVTFTMHASLIHLCLIISMCCTLVAIFLCIRCIQRMDSANGCHCLIHQDDTILPEPRGVANQTAVSQAPPAVSDQSNFLSGIVGPPSGMAPVRLLIVGPI